MLIYLVNLSDVQKQKSFKLLVTYSVFTLECESNSDEI